MDFLINDIVWWKISLYSFVNGWLPGVLTFFLGIWFSRISSRRKLRQELKNNLLEIFIPIFNSGEEITFPLAEETNRKMRETFNAYKSIYPNIFDGESVQKLSKLLNEGFVVNGKVNEKYLNPEDVQIIIRNL